MAFGFGKAGTAKREQVKASGRNEGANFGQLIYEVQQLRAAQDRTNTLLEAFLSQPGRVGGPGLPPGYAPAPPGRHGG